MMFVFPASPQVGDTFQRWYWDGVKWAPLALQLDETPSAPTSGLLQIGTPAASATLQFVPYLGDLVRINSRIYHLPPAGVTQTGQAGAFVNGAAGTLALTTGYFVFLFDNAGTLTFDFRTDTGSTTVPQHVTSTTAGNVGTEIRPGDDTRTLAGYVYTGTAAASLFRDASDSRLTRSWFNRSRAAMALASSWGSNPTGTIPTSVQLSFAAFANEVFLVSCTNRLTVPPAGANAYVTTFVQVDGSPGYGVVATVWGGSPQPVVPATTNTDALPLTYSGLHRAQVMIGLTGNYVGADCGLSGAIL